MADQHNPYAAPLARVDDAAPDAGLQLLADGRAVPAGNGWSWIAAAWRLFRANPGAWILILIVYVLVIGVASAIPILGSFAMYLLAPVLSAGIMAGCAAQARGEALQVSHLFAGFQSRTTQLVGVGALYLAGLLVIMLVAGIIVGINGIGLLSGAAQALAPRVLLLAGLVILALSLPLTMCIWFAPALVFLHGLSAQQAMRSSFVGCLKNIVPFLIYSLALLGLGLLAVIPAGLGLLVLGPVTLASVYTSYRDIFTEALPA